MERDPFDIDTSACQAVGLAGVACRLAKTECYHFSQLRRDLKNDLEYNREYYQKKAEQANFAVGCLCRARLIEYIRRL